MLFSRPSRVASPSLPENIEKFNKAKDIHSKMSIYFDENFYSDHRNDENCYRYMYLIYYMLACKKKYFRNYNDYDEYAQFATNIIYLRFIKKQLEGERIKSVLNYIKSTLYPLKVMYQNATFRNVIVEDDMVNSSTQEMMRQYVQEQYNDGIDEDIVAIFKDIPHYVSDAIKNTPYKYDKIMYRRLKISCLLTLLKSFTLSSEHIKRLEARKEKGLNNTEVLYKMFNKERETSTTLWKLNESMGNYVQVLSNQIRKRIMREIEEIRQSYTLSNEALDSILMTAWDGTNMNDTDNNKEE